MASSPVVKIGLTFLDRDSNKAELTCYCRFATEIENARTYALAMASRIGACSDATLLGYDMAWRWTNDDPGIASESSDVSRKLLMFVVNEADEINGVTLVSPQEAIWETVGSYAGIRLDLASVGAVGFVEMLSSVDFRTEDNRELGVDLVAGGLAL